MIEHDGFIRVFLILSPVNMIIVQVNFTMDSDFSCFFIKVIVIEENTVIKEIIFITISFCCLVSVIVDIFSIRDFIFYIVVDHLVALFIVVGSFCNSRSIILSDDVGDVMVSVNVNIFVKRFLLFSYSEVF